MKYSNFDPLIVSAIGKSHVYFIFRKDGVEVEIDLYLKTVSHSLMTNEIEFLKMYYPFIYLSELKVEVKAF
jgi:hypothetical protein